MPRSVRGKRAPNDPFLAKTPKSLFLADLRKGRKIAEVRINETEEITLNIRGEEATFIIARGTTEDEDVEVWPVTGVFAGKGGPAFLMLMAETENMSREEVVELLESIE